MTAWQGRRRWFAVLALASASCATSAPRSASAPPASATERAESTGGESLATMSAPAAASPATSDAAAMDRGLQALEPLSRDLVLAVDELGSRFESGVECARARTLLGNICELARRICEVAERHPESVSPENCTSANESCASWTRRVALAGCGWDP